MRQRIQVGQIPKGAGQPTCPVCLKPYEPTKAWRRFCSDRCRLISWAVRAVLDASEAGRADGLRDLIDVWKAKD